MKSVMRCKATFVSKEALYKQIGNLLQACSAADQKTSSQMLGKLAQFKAYLKHENRQGDLG